MPFEDVGFVGLGDDLRGSEGIFHEGFELSLETLCGEWRGHRVGAEWCAVGWKGWLFCVARYLAVRVVSDIFQIIVCVIII